MALDKVLSQQMAAMQNEGDGIFVEVQHIYRTLIDQARAAGLPAPEQYWMDPSSEKAVENAKMKSKNAEQRKQEADQQAQQLAQLTLQLEKMKGQNDLAVQQLKNQTAQLQSQLEYQVSANEQLRKWVETELKYGTDVPGQGIGS